MIYGENNTGNNSNSEQIVWRSATGSLHIVIFNLSLAYYFLVVNEPKPFDHASWQVIMVMWLMERTYRCRGLYVTVLIWRLSHNNERHPY